MDKLSLKGNGIEKLFTLERGAFFLIPAYQREYSWTTDYCIAMWNDICDLYKYHSADDEIHFFGTVVVFNNTKNKELAIIDGQQRITSFYLMLRAYYDIRNQAVKSTNDEKVKSMNKIECLMIAKLLWQTDLSGVYDISLPRLVASSDHENDLAFLAKKNTEEIDLEKLHPKSNYRQNYEFFKEKWQDLLQTPGAPERLLTVIKERCILIPIVCDSEESALTIFTTLNDRGMQLTDSDIFKADLFRKCASECDKTKFIEQWNALLECVKDCYEKITCDELFRHYYHYLRAKEQRDHNKELSLRKFYREDANKKYLDLGMITPLVKLAAFWHDVYLTLNNRENWKWLEIPDEANEAAKLLKDFKELLKWVQVLSRMMSDTWRVALSVFFLRYVGEPENFWKYILDFIRNLALYVCYLSIREGSGNDKQKVIIYSLNNKICKEENTPERYFQIEDSLLTKDKLETSMQENCTTKFGDCLVILQAYLKPEQDFCIRLEVEHIRPQSWRNDDPQEEQPNIDWLGNKIALDKKANIKSKDKWLSKKAKKYSESPVKIAKEFAEKYGTQDDWSADDIKRRDNEIINSLWDTFSSWSGSQSSSNFAMP